MEARVFMNDVEVGVVSDVSFSRGTLDAVELHPDPLDLPLSGSRMVVCGDLKLWDDEVREAATRLKPLRSWLLRQPRWLTVWLLCDMTRREAELCGVGDWRLALKRARKLSKRLRHKRRGRRVVWFSVGYDRRCRA